MLYSRLNHAKVYALALGATLLTACTLGVQLRPHNITIDNERCLTPARVVIDDQVVGTVPAGGVGSFPVKPGFHKVDVLNDLPGPEIVQVNQDITFRGGLCVQLP